LGSTFLLLGVKVADFPKSEYLLKNKKYNCAKKKEVNAGKLNKWTQNSRGC
jgi:hypothetical protein